MTHSLLAAAALAVAFGTSRTALAEETCGDTLCPKGYTCETYTSGCPEIACLDEEECKPCEPTEYQACEPAECESDADCGAHMKCAAMESTACEDVDSSAPWEEGTNCEVVAPDEEANCTTTVTHQCHPQRTLPL